MRDTITARASLLSFSLLLAAGTLSAGDKDKELSVRIEGEEGAKVSFSISAGFIDGIVEGLAGSDLDCEATTDEETRAMLEHLDRRGEGSRYRFRDDDGDLIKARRRRGQLELEVERSGENDARVSLPWALAECMLGRRTELPEDSHLELAVEDDGAFRVSID